MSTADIDRTRPGRLDCPARPVARIGRTARSAGAGPVGVLEDIESLIGAETLDAAWDCHVTAMARYGFDRLIYGMSHGASGTELGRLDDMLILSNHSAAYLDRFLGGGLFRDAPMLDWARTNVGVALWSAFPTAGGTASLRERRVLAFNRSKGVVAGATISFGATAPAGRALMSLAARPGLGQSEVDRTWQRDGREIALLNRVAHLTFAALPRARHARKLTPRQREVLRLAGRGLTAAETAAALGVRPVTVEKHLRLARESLGARTTAQAVLKAAIQSQIYL